MDTAVITPDFIKKVQLKRKESDRTALTNEDSDSDRDDLIVPEFAVKPATKAPPTKPPSGVDMSATFGGLERTAVGSKVDEDLAKVETLDKVVSYLKSEIGEDLFEKAAPVLVKHVDNLLYEENVNLVIDALSGILDKPQINKYV